MQYLYSSEGLRKCRFYAQQLNFVKSKPIY